MNFDFSKILNKEQRKSIMDAMLKPFSWGYGAGVWLRNTAFDIGLLPQEEFDVPVVSVGNITVGGTGKTPHVEYIIEALYRRYHVAVLSRGYKRKTQGFILASNNMTPRDIGDEPYQIHRKYSGLITLAVCESRRKGIRELLRIDPDINLILLDDGYQHRYVKPKVNIVLVDYNRPPYEDRLMPLGTLREPARNVLRGDIVVVTKCPTDITAMDIRMVKKNLGLFPYQGLFFSNIRYADPVPVFPVQSPQLTSLQWLHDDDAVLCLTGIATPKPLVRYLRQFSTNLKVMHFDDHHFFTRSDFNDIFKVYNKLEGRRKFIITTEKDAVRIMNNPYYPPTKRNCIFYIPMKVGFLELEGTNFIDYLVKSIDEQDDLSQI
ncbi:MAG: tetraacyldisaccharide 4'-kinase [Muribaculaceae bacterium]|nr:tetraacyldisaccharide 4'-kinase [Muribaculaceae bacterium]MBR5684619.1 tetraacyldisaccharide 4'-kinase [Muribaculaceae bacterium]